MADKTMEDWFLRGGEKPAQENAYGDPDSPHGSDGDDEGVLQDWVVTMSRIRTVQQTAEVRVKAHSEGEAMDLIEDRAEDEADSWPWKDVDYTEEFEDVGAMEAEVAR